MSFNTFKKIYSSGFCSGIEDKFQSATTQPAPTTFNKPLQNQY